MKDTPKQEVKYCPVCGYKTAHVDNKCYQCDWREKEKKAGRL